MERVLLIIGGVTAAIVTLTVLVEKLYGLRTAFERLFRREHLHGAGIPLATEDPDEEHHGAVVPIPATPQQAVLHPNRPQDVSTGRLPAPSNRLIGRDSDLRVLDAAWDDPNTRVVQFDAWGGVGKSALVHAWLQMLSEDDYRGARRVFGWSFYSQGTGDRQTSTDQLFESALRCFGEEPPSGLGPWEKGQRLARLVRAN